jgi:hypothetical protein
MAAVPDSTVEAVRWLVHGFRLPDSSANYYTLVSYGLQD